MVISLQNQNQPTAEAFVSPDVLRGTVFGGKPPKLASIANYSSDDVDDPQLRLARQLYKAKSYKLALEQSCAVYERDPLCLNNLVLMATLYYELKDFDLCIAKAEETLRVEPGIPQCYMTMANAWKGKGNIDNAIHYYMAAIEVLPSFADAWSNLGLAYIEKGRPYVAKQCCAQALVLSPELVTARCNLGYIMHGQGQLGEAYKCYAEALRIQPNFSTARSNIESLLMEVGKHWQEILKHNPLSPEAKLYLRNTYREVVKYNPLSPEANLHLGNIYKDLRMPQAAIMCYRRAIQMRPAEAYGSLGHLCREQGQLEMSIAYFKQAISCDPSCLEAYNRLGNALKDAGRVEEAIQSYNQCIALKPHPHALTSLGNICLERNMLAAAARCYKAALTLTNELSAPFKNLAIVYINQGNYADAITCYNEVMRIDPQAADVLVYRGNVFRQIGKLNEGIQDYLHAISIQPTMAQAHERLAAAFKEGKHLEAAIQSYRQALLIQPDFPGATCGLLHTLLSVCSWENCDKMFADVEAITRKQINMSVLPSVYLFHAIAYPIDSMLSLEISRKYAEYYSGISSCFGLPRFAHPAPIAVKHEGGLGRLRIGYMSSDFRHHPLSHLMGSVFGMHNRENVEVFCYSLGPNDGSEWRQRIQSEAEHFIDVSALLSDAIAKKINEDRIQILINLNGYTNRSRNEVFAMQPAPIQVSYMGSAGTTGASYIDYLITDEFVSPLKFAHIYSEKLVHLPHCYFVTDYKQINQDVFNSVCPHKRSDYGIPEDKFIFACFNHMYNIDPEIFTTWCNILKRVPNSALWLLRFPAEGEKRLRSYAVAQGVHPDQIIFTDKANRSEHIRRSCLADLLLDTPMYNGHTTSTDVLWAGVPMVTLPLEKMATRVAGSLCLATGLGEEMIVSSVKEYEEKAVSLALNRPMLQDLTKKLKAARLTCPLFDTARQVRNLERAYFRMWNLHCSGQQPQHFKVTEDDHDFPSDR